MRARLARPSRWPAPPARLTPARAVQAIALITLLATIVSGLVIHIFDRKDFPTLGSGLWWAVQTVTTVGYGDHVPEQVIGRIVAVWVMLAGIAFVAVATAAVSASLIEEARRRHPSPHDALLAERLDALSDQLAQIESQLRERRAA